LSESDFFAFESRVDTVVAVAHLTEDDEFVVVVNLEVFPAVDDTTLFSSLLGEDRCEVEVEDVDGK